MKETKELKLENLTTAERKKLRALVGKFPDIPWDARLVPLSRRYAFIIEEPRIFVRKEQATKKTFDLKETLLRLLKIIEDGGNVGHSVFRVGIAEDDWDKLENNRERQKKSGEGHLAPVNVTLRISRS